MWSGGESTSNRERVDTYWGPGTVALGCRWPISGWLRAPVSCAGGVVSSGCLKQGVENSIPGIALRTQLEQVYDWSACFSWPWVQRLVAGFCPPRLLYFPKFPRKSPYVGSCAASVTFAHKPPSHCCGVKPRLLLDDCRLPHRIPDVAGGTAAPPSALYSLEVTRAVGSCLFAFVVQPVHRCSEMLMAGPQGRWSSYPFGDHRPNNGP